MSEITQELPRTAALPRADLPGVAARIGQAVRSFLVRSRTDRIVAGLSEDQLRDIGVDRSTVLGNRPAMVIEAGVMPRLMSMR